jgi:hypothetical protein
MKKILLYISLILIPLIVIIGGVYYVFHDMGSASWQVTKILSSPDKNIKAKVKCLNSTGATVGFYCKLILVDQMDDESEIALIRTPNIPLWWRDTNHLEIKVQRDTKIYNFDSVYWDKRLEKEYYINLKYK